MPREMDAGELAVVCLMIGLTGAGRDVEEVCLITGETTEVCRWMGEAHEAVVLTVLRERVFLVDTAFFTDEVFFAGFFVFLVVEVAMVVFFGFFAFFVVVWTTAVFLADGFCVVAA
ncbi:hypothetical protein BDZ85DRAFT_262582 [Elsinoe ampelina]|uniref:Uncharacterized protein n=1 Tax=Elsinoe ampelina TaxID=302913 RepID=A0A6A6GBC7_9PEZI|nr:hypothetical protein BDZ85DRAFT_262582 [Elsinoe ampelina]